MGHAHFRPDGRPFSGDWGPFSGSHCRCYYYYYYYYYYHYHYYYCCCCYYYYY